MSGVLVTGATTPLGRRLVHELLRHGEGHVLAVGVEDGPGGLPAPSRRFRYVQVNLTRSRSLRDLLFGPTRDAGVTTVVHTAQHRDPLAHGRAAHRLDVEVTRELLHLAERHPTIRRFVYRSFGEVYRVDPHRPTLLSEDHPLDLSARAPAWVRHRIEADLLACARMGMVKLSIAVLRCAEVLAPESGSQLWDYLGSRVCLQPLGYDPMLNVLSLDDAARALRLAALSDVQGLFNVPGADTLPLSRLIALARRVGVPVPGPLLAPLYGLRRVTVGGRFRWDMNAARFHFSAVLDGARAARELGYVPAVPIVWDDPARSARIERAPHGLRA